MGAAIELHPKEAPAFPGDGAPAAALPGARYLKVAPGPHRLRR